jgi:RNA polymerase sigma factor (sigma-70 family)
MKAGRDLERLYARHKRDVYRSVLRDVRDPDEAEDITQTAFLDAFRALRRGDEPEHPHAWLLTIAQNASRRRYRSRVGRQSEVELDAEVLAAPDREGPSAEDIRVALERLRPAQREALVLREIGGRSYIEIAAAMDISVPAIETLLFRARRALRFELEDEAPRTRRRVLGGLLPWPFGWDSYASILGWLTGRGASVKIAGAVSAAVLGTGVGIQQGLVLRGDPGPAHASAAAPTSVQPQSTQSPETAGEPADAPRSGAKQAPAKQQASSQAEETAQPEAARPLKETTTKVVTGVTGLTTAAQREVDAVVRTLQAAPERATPYIRKIPKVVSGTGALSAAEIPSAITLRVSTGSTIPSSQRRAVE